MTAGDPGGASGTAVSVSVPAPSNTTLNGLALWCQMLIGQNDQTSLTILYAYLNQAQKDWEMEFPDHNSLQKSQQMPLTGPTVAGLGQDVCYHFTDTAPDFRKERLIRMVEPLNYAHPLNFIEYTHFREMVNDIALWTAGLPQYWYWAPEDPTGIHVYPIPNRSDYVLQFDYVAYAPELINANDVPYFDHEFHKSLGFQALFYWYNSESIAKPDVGAQWSAMFEAMKRRYKKDQQRRQLQSIKIPYATGVNEGRNRRGRPYYFR